MTRFGASFELPRHIGSSWPEDVAPADVWAGDESAADPATYAAYTAWVRPAQLTEAEFHHWEAEFQAAYHAVLRGEQPWGATDASAAALALDEPLRFDRRPARPAVEIVDDDVICDLTEDWLPSVGLTAPGRLLGPFGMLDLPRRVRVFAGACLAFPPAMYPSIRPMSRPCRSKPKSPLAVRSGLIATLRAPMMLWRHHGGGVLEPLLPVFRHHIPQEPVRRVPDAPVVLGRAVAFPGGWWLACALPLPVAPDPEIVLRRATLEYQRLRRHDRRLTWEDLLRDRGELLVRTCAEWLAVHAPDDVLPLWRAWSAGWAPAPRVGERPER